MTPDGLKQARKDLGNWTQDKLAFELGISRSSVARMEAGQSRIVKAIDLAVKWLKANPEETGGPEQRG